VSDGGIWQPPQPGTGPEELPVTAVELEPRPPAPRQRRPGVVIAAVVGGAAIAAGAVFGITRLASDDNSGGAATPEEAGLALLTALENEDVLGIIDVLLPGERETLRDPVTDLTDELRRLEVLSDEADLSAVSGVDLVLENESARPDATNVDDIVNLDITAGGTATVDGEALPLGDLVLDNVETDLSELDSEASSERGDELRFRLTAVEEDGRWYLSLFHSIAETARADASEPVEIPNEGIAPVGGDGPEDAVDAFLTGVEELDLETVIATLNPNEFQALQRYAPTFLDDAQAELDQAVADEGVSVTIGDPEYTVTGDGDTRSLSIDYLRVDVTADDGTITGEFEDGCWKATADGEEVNSCELAEDTPRLEEMFDDPEQIKDLLAVLEETFADYENPGFIVKQVDGQWYLSPFATVSDQLLAVLRALDRDELDRIIEEVPDAFEEAVGEDGAFELDIEEGTTVIDETVPAPESAPPGTSSPTETTVDPAGVCFTEPTGEEAGACFRELIDAGKIEASVAPIYVLYPECGLAEVYWSGEYTSLPDAEFVALVEETAPCFQRLVRTGELTRADLPLELSNPECLNGRNWFTAIEDEEFSDAVFDCAYG
jgi:hypothetical protein